MKKLISAVFAATMAAGAVAAFAQEDDALRVAPNALRTIESNTPAQMPNDTAGDPALRVAPNAQQTYTSTETYIFEEDYTQ
jgi:hypothetical protein